MSEMTEEGAKFVALVEGQLDVYRKLQRVVRRQRDFVASADPSPLLGLLGDRQRLTDELQVSTRETGGVAAQWEVVREGLSDTERDRVRVMVDEMRGILKEIAEADREDVDRLIARKRNVASQMQSLVTGQSMLGAYAGSCASGRTLNTIDETDNTP